MRILLFSWIFLIPLYSIFFSIDIIAMSRQCLDDQKSLLHQMKKSLEFDHLISTKLVKWDQTVDCCSWGGVTCDNAGHVIGLNLSGESISGGINNSSGLFSLQYLQSLDLSYNNFNSTEISPGFHKLTSLSHLNLSNANFAGQIPIEISRMTSLVTLDFSTLYFPGTRSLKLENPDLLKLVQNLTGLTELYLDGVNISAKGNEWCQALSSSLPNLRVLSLSNCYLSGPIDFSLVKLRSLSVIRLDNNNLSIPVPEFFANFTNLTSLHLSSSGLYGTFPEKIFQVTTLETLDLSNNGLLEGFLPEFPHNGSLQMLVLSSTNFAGNLPDSMGSLKGLSRIELTSCKFSGSIPNSMASLEELVYVDFSSNSFIGSIPSFSSSKNLALLNLAHNRLNGSILSTDWEGLSNLESLDLRNNSFNGRIPLSIFANPLVQNIRLSFNQFSGQFDEFREPPSSRLEILDLGCNNLEGSVPVSAFELQSLKILTLSFNNFNGTIELSTIQKLQNLTALDLSHNNLSINATSGDSFPPRISTLKLASCNLRVFPNLMNHSRLNYLDLSNNQIQGKVPNWIWNIGDGFLRQLNLSCNLLVELEQPFPADHFYHIDVLDLHSNMLQGQIPVLPPFAIYLDYSRNNFSSIIPTAIGNNLTSTVFFSLSSNNFHGSVPESICNAAYLQVLDLSNNSLSGKIPQCLTKMSETLGVLDLGENNLTGNISDTFPGICCLKTLDLNGNFLKGQVPKSLANCVELEVIDLGNNQINDNFPCWLKNISSLRVLVLRSNKFHGSIECPKSNSTWAMLQIVDLASNNFSGKLPSQSFHTWRAMMGDEDEAQPKLNHLQFEFLGLTQLYYQDAVRVTSKGLEMELVKILTIFTSIDFSCNNFQGKIPQDFGDFKSLYVLNLSYNSFTGQIPSSLGKLSQLESLDLSRNYLSGEIPMELARLNFLSFLNFSYNQLVGRVPKSTQLQSFSEASFKGNKGLCGLPLNVTCTNTVEAPPFEDKHSDSGTTQINWMFVGAEIGYFFGLGVVIGPLVFWKRWRKWYYKHVDRIVLKILYCQHRNGGHQYGRRARRYERFRLKRW